MNGTGPDRYFSFYRFSVKARNNGGV